MGATDDSDDLVYLSKLRFGRFAAILLSVLIAMTCLLATGIYWPNRADKLWPLVSRKALPERVEPLDDSTVISLTRTLCFGWCPEYTVRIFGSGRVDYVGVHYVCTFGAQAATADAREVRRLVEAMIGTGFFDYAWQKAPFRPTTPPLRRSSSTQVGRMRCGTITATRERRAGCVLWRTKSTEWLALRGGCPVPASRRVGERCVQPPTLASAM